MHLPNQIHLRFVIFIVNIRMGTKISQLNYLFLNEKL